MGPTILWGLNICVGQENKEGTDQRLDRIYVQDRRTWEGTDLIRALTNTVRGEYECINDYRKSAVQLLYECIAGALDLMQDA